MKNAVVILIRVFLGLVFFCSGMARLFAEHRFPGFVGAVWLGDAFESHGLVLYMRFIAYTQLIIGLLLLTQRFAALGTLLLLPMLLNIVMLAVSLRLRDVWGINLGLLCLNLILIFAEYHRLKFIFSDEPRKLVKVEAERSFPFHDLVFLIGIFMVLISPFLSHLSDFLAYFIMALGFLICYGIQYYEGQLKKWLRSVNKNFFE